MKQEANWEYWNQMKSFLLCEGVYLQLGKIPPADNEDDAFQDEVEELEHTPMYKRLFAELCIGENSEYWQKREEQCNAAYGRISRADFIKYWKKAGLRFHENFLIHKEQEHIGAKERESMLKLIIGMAVIGYTYKPNAARNDSTKEIAGDLLKLGIPLNEDTIRKYLNEAKELLPPQQDI